MSVPPPERPLPPGWRRALREIAVDLSPLREHREFRLLFTGQLVSFAGSMITFVAVPFQVYELTRSSLAVGLLGLAEIVPILGLSLVGGALSDAIDRRRMLLWVESLSALAVAALAVNAASGSPSLPVVYAAAALLAGLYALQRPSLDALVPRLVPREQMAAALALNWLRGNLGQIAGPALGGLLLAAVGLSATYTIDCATFLAAVAAIAAMRAVPPSEDAPPPSVRSVVEGFRYARSRPELLGTYLVDMNAMFFAMPNALYPALAAGYGGASVLGLLYAAPAVGSFLVALTSGWVRRVHRHGRAVVVAAGCWGLFVLGFGLADALWLALVLLGAAGAADAVSGLFRGRIWNETVPDALRGRLAGIEMISYTSGPLLGDVRAGAVAAAAGTRVSLVSGGALCMAGTALLAFALPSLWRYDARAGGGDSVMNHTPMAGEQA